MHPYSWPILLRLCSVLKAYAPYRYSDAAWTTSLRAALCEVGARFECRSYTKGHPEGEHIFDHVWVPFDGKEKIEPCDRIPRSKLIAEYELNSSSDAERLQCEDLEKLLRGDLPTEYRLFIAQCGNGTKDTLADQVAILERLERRIRSKPPSGTVTFLLIVMEDRQGRDPEGARGSPSLRFRELHKAQKHWTIAADARIVP